MSCGLFSAPRFLRALLRKSHTAKHDASRAHFCLLGQRRKSEARNADMCEVRASYASVKPALVVWDLAKLARSAPQVVCAALQASFQTHRARQDHVHTRTRFMVHLAHTTA